MTNLTSPFPATPHKLGLYPVVDSVEWIARLLEAGVTTIQLRIKDLQTSKWRRTLPPLSPLASAIRPGCLSMIIGGWRLSMMPTASTWGRKIWTPPIWPLSIVQGLRLGVSTHDDAELARAIAVKPSYIALGHIFPLKPRRCPLSHKAWPSCDARRRITGVSHSSHCGISIERVPQCWPVALAAWPWSAPSPRHQTGVPLRQRCCS
ncbi:Thiamine-phosphate synthase [Serratia fonticola]|uniref:Thiamine-phosphate synthase n=1 Tax=Serratia fonticola TaxID=47917 RepID=A0A4U9WLI6_SERFO|nr:Thiamine-phosphate synthase [Serratia fonticola]